MRLLLDESVPAKLKRALPNHSVRTIVEMGWFITCTENPCSAASRNVVVMSLDECTRMIDTLRIYTSPQNRADLERAIAAAKRDDDTLTIVKCRWHYA